MREGLNSSHSLTLTGYSVPCSRLWLHPFPLTSASLFMSLLTSGCLFRRSLRTYCEDSLLSSDTSSRLQWKGGSRKGEKYIIEGTRLSDEKRGNLGSEWKRLTERLTGRQCNRRVTGDTHIPLLCSQAIIHFLYLYTLCNSRREKRTACFTMKQIRSHLSLSSSSKGKIITPSHWMF